VKSGLSGERCRGDLLGGRQEDGYQRPSGDAVLAKKLHPYERMGCAASSYNYNWIRT
jgi:hypothetical protein